MERDEILKTIISSVSEQLGVCIDNITEASSFTKDLEADSLDLIELVMAFEDEFEVQIPDEDFDKINTVSDAVDEVIRLKS